MRHLKKHLNLKETKIKNWDTLTKWILGISIFVIVFSFLSPIIFTSSSSYEIFDFTNTGQIGDTIGGILNPFIALAGVLLTFLAFYMQIKANQIQISQFNKGLSKEKEIRLLTEKKDYYNKLNLLKVDLASIKSDIQSKSEKIKIYYEKERDLPFETNFLIRTPSKNYTRILEIDRLSIFNGFSLFLSHRERWIKDFSNLYNILDFLPDLFDDIYKKHEYHSKDLFDKKMEIRNGLVKLMDELSKIINTYLAENTRDNYLSFPASSLANTTILRYYDIIAESYDENRNPIRETDFVKLDEEVLKFFNQEVLELRKDENTYDSRLEPIVEFIGTLRKQLYLIKQRAQEFATSIESQYEHLMVDKENEKSYITIIDEIHSILETELEKITIEE